MKKLLFTSLLIIASVQSFSQVSSVTVNNNTTCDMSIRIYGSDNDYTCFDSSVPCAASTCVSPGVPVVITLPAGCQFIHYCQVQERHPCPGNPGCISTSVFASIDGCLGYGNNPIVPNTCSASCVSNANIEIDWTNQSVIDIW
jgi:hypothetical protein